MLAHALSWFFVGVLVSSFSHVSTMAKADFDLAMVSSVVPEPEGILIASVNDNFGRVTNDSGDIMHVASVSTPFSHGEYDRAEWDLRTAKILEETDATVTIRLDDADFKNMHSTEDRSIRPQLTIEVLERLVPQLVWEFTIDRESRTMITTRTRLKRTVGKMFVFRLRKMESIRHYKFNKDCRCMAITQTIEEREDRRFLSVV